MNRVRAVEPVERVNVIVTFLRMDRAPEGPPPPFPEPAQVVTVPRPSVAFYRYLYDTVGAPHLWWLRRAISDADLAAALAAPGVSLHVLYVGGEPVGFYELEARFWPAVNLAYFGLVPHMVGRGLGYPLLCHAVALVWAHGAKAMTVNTCTADHPRALPNYHRVGFQTVRAVREQWPVPLRLGLVIPQHLRAGGRGGTA